MLTRTWERGEAAKLIGTTPRRLAGWAEQGLLEATVEGRGKGSRRLYTIANLVEGVVLLALDKAGLGDTFRRGTLAMVRGQIEQGRVVDQLLAGKIAPATDNLLFVVMGFEDGSAMAVFGHLAEWFSPTSLAVASISTVGLSVLTVPMEKPLAGLLERLKEDAAK